MLTTTPPQTYLPAAVLAATVWASTAAFPTSTDPVTTAPTPAHATVDTFSQHAVIYFQAAPAELEHLRDSISADDFEVMADHLMYYRSVAYDLLDRIWIDVVTFEGRRPLAFMVDGEVREYSFTEPPTLDLIVAYRPGREPQAVAPIDVAQVPVYFGFTGFPPASVSEEHPPLPATFCQAPSRTPLETTAVPNPTHTGAPCAGWGRRAVYQWIDRPPRWMIYAVENEPMRCPATSRKRTRKSVWDKRDLSCTRSFWHTADRGRAHQRRNATVSGTPTPRKSRASGWRWIDGSPATFLSQKFVHKNGRWCRVPTRA